VSDRRNQARVGQALTAMGRHRGAEVKRRTGSGRMRP
jgi:hypothetical protein